MKRLRDSGVARSATLLLVLGIVCVDPGAAQSAGNEPRIGPASSGSSPRETVGEKDMSAYRESVVASTVGLVGSLLKGVSFFDFIADGTIRRFVDHWLDTHSRGWGWIDVREVDYVGKVTGDLAHYLETSGRDGQEISRWEPVSTYFPESWSLIDGLRKHFEDPSNVIRAYRNKKAVVVGRILSKSGSHEEIISLAGALADVEVGFDLVKHPVVVTALARCHAEKGEDAHCFDADEHGAFVEAGPEKVRIRSPNISATKFAFRRYRDGGLELVDAYAMIVADLRGELLGSLHRERRIGIEDPGEPAG